MYTPPIPSDGSTSSGNGPHSDAALVSYLAFSENPLDPTSVIAFAEECAKRNSPGWVDAVRLARSLCEALDEPSVKCAELCAKAGLADDSFRLATRAHVRCKGKLPSYLLLSELFGNQGEIDAALRMLELAWEDGLESEKYNFAVGNTLYLAGRLDEAATWASKNYVSNRESRLLLARCMVCDVEKWEEGVLLLERWLLEHPDDQDAYHYLTSALLRKPGNFERAKRWCVQGIQVFPYAGYLHFHYAWVLLSAGFWGQGWEEYEWRWALKKMSYQSRFSHPPGERDWIRAGRKKGGLAYIHGEQGAGDNFMFLKCLPALREHFQEIVLAVHPDLVDILSELNVADEVISISEPWPRFDAHLPIGSLPLALKLFNLDDAEALCARNFRPKVKLYPPQRLERPRIGLNWGGTALGPEDKRAVPERQLIEFLSKDHGVEFVLLQQGLRNLMARQSLPRPEHCIDMRNALPKWSATAQVMMQLDGMLTIDSGPAHLAGLLGVPTAIVLSWNPDWRWLDPSVLPEYEGTSLWYRSVRVFRAANLNDYTDSLERGLKYLVDRLETKFLPANNHSVAYTPEIEMRIAELS